MRREPACDDRAARQAEAARRGNRLFLPALVIPATALAGTFAFKAVPAWSIPSRRRWWR